jgi:NADPH:quinone reductase-like Zn-dependent oxidoreductase
MYLAEVALPDPGDREVRVRVTAAGINPVDWKIRNAQLKLADGHLWPRRMGCEFAGTVDTVGQGVSEFQPGDGVFGWTDLKTLGAMAEFVVVRSDQLYAKPPSLSMSAAAALPMVGATAYTAMRKKGSVEGKRVLVNGGSGGLGHLAIQLARMDHAHVTATARSDHQQKLLDFGASRAVDYRVTDVSAEGERYDLILDAADTLSWSQAKDMLNPYGTYLGVEPSLGSLLGGVLVSMFTNKRREALLVRVDRDTLQRLHNLVEIHGLHVHVGREYRLADYEQAYTELENGNRPAGKAVFVV